MTKSNNLLADYAAKKQDICIKNDTISDSLFKEYGVNRGLRDVNGKGVLTGLTNISEIVSFKTGEDGSSVPCDGQLWYRGYNVKTLTNNLKSGEFGFEKIAYLLLFGQLPSDSELAEFTEVLGRSRTLPTNFTRDVIMKAPSKDIMNSMTRSILTLASYDPLVAKAGIDNNIRQCLSLVAIFPMLAVYGYHAYNHYENDQSMYIHRPDQSFRQLKTSLGCSELTINIQSLKQGCLIWRLFCIWSTAVETTPHLPPVWLHRQVQIHTLLSRQPCHPLRDQSTAVPISR